MIACRIWQITDRKIRRMVMQKYAIAIMAAIVMGGLPVSTAVAASHHVRAGASLPNADPAVRDGYIMNGNFDWRRLRPGEGMPWYAHGYSNDCVAWTPHAYHYACDPNGRY
jgi:hypothetical protein